MAFGRRASTFGPRRWVGRRPTQLMDPKVMDRRSSWTSNLRPRRLMGLWAEGPRPRPIGLRTLGQGPNTLGPNQWAEGPQAQKKRKSTSKSVLSGLISLKIKQNKRIGEANECFWLICRLIWPDMLENNSSSHFQNAFAPPANNIQTKMCSALGTIGE